MMTITDCVFYAAFLAGNTLLAVEWAKYGFIDAALENKRLVLGVTVNIVAFFIGAISHKLPSNAYGYYAVVAACVFVFFLRRATLPAGRLEYNKASKRISHWLRRHYIPGMVLPNRQSLKSFSPAEGARALLLKAMEKQKGKNSLSDRAILALYYERLGRLDRMMNNFPQAQTLFGKSLQLLRELNLERPTDKNISCTLAIVLFDIAELYHSLRRYKEALQSYRESLDIDKSLGNEGAVARTQRLMREISSRTPE